MEQINWYPGHMAKARRQLAENLKLIDVVVEIVDARAPRASRNPDFDDLFAQKVRIVLLNKSDLADDVKTELWLKEFRSKGIYAARMVSTASAGRAQGVRLIEASVSDRVQRMKEKGVQKTVRALVVGIPNVGKSTFINRIAGDVRAKVGDKPGVTKAKQWVKASPYLELLDTPGLLWPKLEDQAEARRLAYIGSINDEILSIEDLALSLLKELRTICPDKLSERYRKITAETPDDALLEELCQSRGFVQRGGTFDTERGARVLLDEFRGGKIARVTLEWPEEAQHGEDA